MSNYALFGAAGNSESFNAQFKSSLSAPKWLREEMKLDAYEYQCGHGVRVSSETAQKLGAEAQAHSIALSIHAPYYVNLSNLDAMDNNVRYIMQSCAAAKAMGATRITVHAGSVGGRDRLDALTDNGITLTEIQNVMLIEGYSGITLCVETMGKINQMGSFDEIMSLCANDERLLPCIDFGHLYARSLGVCYGYEETKLLFDHMENEIGKERASRFHAHFSKIEFNKGGERRHVRLDNTEFGPDFRPVATLVAECGYAPTFICESDGTQAEDAAEMKRIYFEELGKI